MTKRTFHFECQEEDEFQVEVKRKKVEVLTNSNGYFFSGALSKPLWKIFSNASDTLKKPFKLLGELFSSKKKGPQQESLHVDVQQQDKGDIKEIVIYTDGSVKHCGSERMSGIGIFVNEGHPLNKSVQLLPSHDCNMAEILAITTALKSIRDWPGYKQERIIIRTDRREVVRQLRSGYYGSLADQIYEIYILARGFPNGVLFEYVQGHAGNPGNEQADTLARAAIGLRPCTNSGFRGRRKPPLFALITPDSPLGPQNKTNNSNLASANKESSTLQARDCRDSPTDTPKKYKKNEDSIFKLIELVSKQPCLYNSNVQGNQFVAWSAVVNQLGMDSSNIIVCNSIRSLWKSKLEVFVKEYNRLADLPQEYQHPSAICPYYNELDWIEPYLAKKVADGEPANKESPKMVLTSELRPSKSTNLAPSSHSQYKKWKNSKEYNAGKVKNVESYFAKEIAFQLGTLPQDLKIEAENKLREVLCDFVKKNNVE